MGKGSGSSIAGYRYYCGLQLIFCNFLDNLTTIGVGDNDQIAWSGTVTENQTIYIDSPDLFGGENGEGGVQGSMDVCFGASDQARNGYLQSVLGSDIPAFRGLFQLVFNHGLVSMNNPYIKQWWIIGTRTKSGWRDDLSDIVASDGIIDMNPAHIIREVATNTVWGGLAYPISDLDDASFETAANLLQAEGFGLSLLWAKNTSAEDFIGIILNHINGVYYFAHDTGLLTLKLIRNDYSLGGIPSVDESSIISMVEFSMPAVTESINQVTINYVDRNNLPCAVTVQDIAGIERMGGQVNASTIDFVGISTSDLASTVASRELIQSCIPLASCTFDINRKHGSFNPGSCFALNWGPLGIINMVMRVVSVDTGEIGDNKLRIQAIRDVFGYNTATFTTPESSLWSSPHNEPVDAPYQVISELSWWQFVREYPNAQYLIDTGMSDLSTFIIGYCGRPWSDALNYELWVGPENADPTNYSKVGTGAFPFICLLGKEAVPELESVLELAGTYIDQYLVTVGEYAILGEEIVGVLAIDFNLNTVTVSRGLIDTIPVTHPVGTPIWFNQGMYVIDTQEAMVNESLSVKLLPSTSLGRLSLVDATAHAYTCAGRMMKPYPPGNVKINTLRWPSSIGSSDLVTVTWSHRDRLTQTVQLDTQDSGDIGPEAGVTYTIRFYGETNVLKHTYTGIAGTTCTWSTEIADSGLGRLNTSVRIELESDRGTLTSLNMWNLTVNRV